ncbi:LTA synthase family protein [Eubacterium sp. 1001713B170207_170306_E7]|uniref:LTA synthase family protein n=1 Tax=Eubacterium sp. 1001713B170207_170306_E7 TaxID=2787097 RepID=UPI001896D030|nr:LTA synthase family protein [Eubacterium sp. 1001713B170207_170306_E7]
MNSVITFKTSKKRILTALAVTAVLSMGLALCYQTMGFDERYLNTAGLCVFMIGLTVFSDITCRGPAAALWNVLLLILASAFSYTIFQIFQEAPFDTEGIRLFLNLSCCMAVYVFLYILTGRMRASLMGGGILLYAFGLAGYFVRVFRGDILLYTDLFSAKTGLQVASAYHFELSGTILIATLVLAALLLWAFKAHRRVQDQYKGRKLRLTAFAALTITFGLFFETNVERYYYAWDMPVNGYPYTFTVNAKLSHVREPEGYDLAFLGESIKNTQQPLSTAAVGRGGITEKAASGPVAKKNNQPNIIAIMNESFSDLRTVGDFSTNIDYMPFIDSLSENTVKGNLYVSVFGGGTCDSEYAFLTGNTTAYLPENARPYQLYVKGPAPSLVSTLNYEGYSSYAIHPGERNAWNRDKVYPNFGFQQFFSNEEFIDADRTRESWVSDAATYDKVIELYENKGDHPLFVFDVTIQNHAGYQLNADDLEPVLLEGMEGSYPETEQYLSLMRDSDAAFKNLIDYFSGQEEPTLVVMFGDHQAYIEQAFYEELMQKPLDQWSTEELQKRYVTPFVIWANYDIPEAQVDKLSVNYLSSLLLEQAGIQGTPYNDYLMKLSETLPVINSVGIIDNEGQYFRKGDPTIHDRDVLEYRQMLYNNMLDTARRRNDLFYPASDF